VFPCFAAQDETTLSPADSDGWLNVDPAQLETYLNQQWGNVKDRKLDQESLSLREKVQSFLNQTSDIDGVHFLGYVACRYVPRREQKLISFFSPLFLIYVFDLCDVRDHPGDWMIDCRFAF